MYLGLFILLGACIRICCTRAHHTEQIYLLKWDILHVCPILAALCTVNSSHCGKIIIRLLGLFTSSQDNVGKKAQTVEQKKESYYSNT